MLQRLRRMDKLRGRGGEEGVPAETSRDCSLRPAAQALPRGTEQSPVSAGPVHARHEPLSHVGAGASCATSGPLVHPDRRPAPASERGVRSPAGDVPEPWVCLDVLTLFLDA